MRSLILDQQRKVDTELKQSIRIISGTICCTPIAWLPVLSNITPPHIRKEKASVKKWGKYNSKPDLAIHQEFILPQRLKSKNLLTYKLQISSVRALIL